MDSFLVECHIGARDKVEAALGAIADEFDAGGKHALHHLLWDAL